LLRWDSVMGEFPGDVRADDDYLYAGGQRVAMTAERDPAAIPWRQFGVVRADDDYLDAGGQRVAMTAVRDPAAIPWRQFGVDIVVESTGVFRSRAKLEPHLAAGAAKVILTVPAKDEIDRMVVIGVNDDQLQPTDRIVSNASCTTNCLAPVAR